MFSRNLTQKTVVNEEKKIAALIDFIDAMEVREVDKEFQNPVDIMFIPWILCLRTWGRRIRNTSQSGSTKNINWLRVTLPWENNLINCISDHLRIADM